MRATKGCLPVVSLLLVSQSCCKLSNDVWDVCDWSVGRQHGQTCQSVTTPLPLPTPLIRALLCWHIDTEYEYIIQNKQIMSLDQMQIHTQIEGAHFFFKRLPEQFTGHLVEIGGVE